MPNTTQSTKNILVTGGCGFVGRHLIKNLLKQDQSQRIYVIDDLSTGQSPASWLPQDFSPSLNQQPLETFSRGNTQVIFYSTDLVATIIDSNSFLNSDSSFHFDQIFHFAAVVGGRANIENNPLAVGYDLAIDGSLFNWLGQNSQRVGSMLYASSSAAYPIHHQTKSAAIPLAEHLISFDQNLGMPDMTYGWSKLTGEYLAKIAHATHNLNVVCIRPFSGYGGDQDQSYPIPAIARRVAERHDPLIIWGSGDQERDFVHIEDCVDAMLLAITNIHDGSGINIGSGLPTSFKQIANTLADIAGYKPKFKLLLNKPTGVHSRVADNKLAKEKLNWTPKISLREGLTSVLSEQSKILSDLKENTTPSKLEAVK